MEGEPAEVIENQSLELGMRFIEVTNAKGSLRGDKVRGNGGAQLICTLRY